MSFFKRILNISEDSVASGDKRKAPRHPVGQTFPVKCVITLIGHDEDGNPLPDNAKGQDWTGRLVNMSTFGASMQLHPAASARRGEPCTLRLSLGNSHLEIPGTIAQFRVYRDYALCGFSLQFPNFETQKSYLQLVEPVVFGSTLVPRATEKVVQDTPGLHKEEYLGRSDSHLTVWRDVRNNSLCGFDFRMRTYGVRWSSGMAELDTYGFTAGGHGDEGQVQHLSEAQQEEVRWLFCLAVPNLAKAVPSDARKFLTQVVA
ncbi:MAG TPA: PilZ domain-containing protein [Candidatus Didemnitutus sp.]|nr:PilZ domain-containing protein [Candidatus Didemnitutus sp.]